MSNRELDALVAEKIFGSIEDAFEWAVVMTEDPNRVIAYRDDERWANTFKTENDFDDEWEIEKRGKRFSTDPAACQQLKDKARADGWCYLIQARSTGEYLARFYRDEGPDFETTTEAEGSDPVEFRAIVIAALRAHGVEVPE